MKLSYFLGTLLLLGAGSFALTEATFATDDQTVATPAATVAITKPSAQSITAAITKVQNIGAYRTHFSGNNPSPLTSDVTFYQEYNYLLSLVKTAQNLLANYDTATVDQLNEIIAAANDAEIACNLLFGTDRPAKVNHQPQTLAATAQPASTSSSNTTPAAQQSSTPAPATKTAPVTTTAATEVNQQDAVTDNSTTLTVSVHVGAPTSAESAEPISEAATLATENSDETDNQTPALALAHTATATVTGCALGTLYLKERRTYRPGRH